MVLRVESEFCTPSKRETYIKMCGCKITSEHLRERDKKQIVLIKLHSECVCVIYACACVCVACKWMKEVTL